MKPKDWWQQGRYDFAVGEPYPDELQQRDGWLRSKANHEQGLDVLGDPQVPPHVCTRDKRKVCVCNGRASRGCPLEPYPPRPPSIFDGPSWTGLGLRERIKRSWKAFWT